MKLSDKGKPSMWEMIAAKPEKPKRNGKVAPGMAKHTAKKQREGPEEYASVLLNLALHGVLNADGGFKF